MEGEATQPRRNPHLLQVRGEGGEPPACKEPHAPRACCALKHLIEFILEPDCLGSNPITHLPAVSSWASDLTAPCLSFLKGKTGTTITVSTSEGWAKIE